MVQNSGSMTVRTGRELCKRPGRRCPDNRRLLLLAALGATLALSACHATSGFRTISLDALERAPTVAATTREHVLVTDPQPLRELCVPLGPRLGLIQVRSVRQWDLLARAVPQLRECPDFRRGALVGLLCWAGTPLDERWPIRIEGVHVQDGAGLIRAEFHSGTYLPDGVTFLDIAHVPGLAVVLAVDVNGTTYYPE